VSEVQDWRASAACARPGVDPEVFFPATAGAGAYADAAAICKTCPVTMQCMEWALTHPAPDLEFGGMLAGLTPPQLADMRRRLDRAAREAAGVDPGPRVVVARPERRASHCSRGHDQEVHGVSRRSGKRACGACQSERRRVLRESARDRAGTGPLCGTVEGYAAHQVRKNRICPGCWAAHTRSL
jgi:hypothetical protein